MFTPFSRTGNREEEERLFLDALSSLLIAEEGSILKRFTNLSNIAAAIYSFLLDLNWAGFYLFDGKELVLGPFQGEVACTTIALARGVCGKAARERKTVIVDDVNLFPGHIACSEKSKSELVVPIIKAGELYGVIDLDSPIYARFKAEDATLIERVAEIVSKL